MNEDNKMVVFVLGTSFSGSTLISSSLVSKHIESIGEANRFLPLGMHSAPYGIESCTSCIITELNSEDCKLFGTARQNAINSVDNHVNKYLELIKPTRNIVIDSSKDAEWMNILIDNGLSNKVGVFGLVVVRNPISYAFSEHHATGLPFWKCIEGWRNTYQHIFRSLLLRHIPWVVFRYEDLFIANICSALEHQLKRFLEPDLRIIAGGQPITHMIGGNLGVYLSSCNSFNFELARAAKCFDEGDLWKIENYKLGEIKESTRWTSMSKHDACSLLEIPGVIETATMLNYNIMDILNYL